jgi:hypothetical protein
MLTRREFVAQAVAAVAAIGAFSAAPGAAAAVFGETRCSLWARREPVVSFHMDRPYLDWTGTAIPYCPPDGARSGEPAARLSDEAFRRMQCYA